MKAIPTDAVRAARPHLVRATLAGTIAVVALVVASSSITSGAGLIDQIRSISEEGRDIAGAAGLLIFLIAGIIAVRASAKALKRAMEVKVGDNRGAPVALALSVFGYLLILLPALQLLGVDLGGLLLGGAITGVVVGIAAQQTLGNFFAGMVLLIVRPFTLGEHIVLRSGPLGGEYQGRVSDMGLFYTELSTDAGAVRLPNSGVLASAVGPGASNPREPLTDGEPPPGTPRT